MTNPLQLSTVVLMKDLYSETLELLRRDQRTYREISEGAEVNIHWLRRLVRTVGSPKNPGVTRIEKLHSYLVRSKRAKRLSGTNGHDLRT